METATHNMAEMQKKISRTMNLWTILANDVTQTLKEMELAPEQDQPFRKRTFIRTFFACVEGVCFGMRSLCDEALTLPETCQPDAVFLKKLHEERASFIDAVKISFKGFAKIFQLDFSLDVNGRAYEAFFKSKDIRDRLTHPKRAVDLMLSSEEIEEAKIAVKWFNDEMVRLSKCPIGKKKPMTK